MAMHLTLIRKLPAHQLRRMGLAAGIGAELLSSGDAGKNPAYVRIEGCQDWFESAALAGSGKM